MSTPDNPQAGQDWANQAFEQFLQSPAEVTPIEMAQVLAGHDKQLVDLARDGLATSPDTAEFQRRLDILYNPTMTAHYKAVAQGKSERTHIPPEQRFVHQMGEAVVAGLGGLTNFCVRHPEVQFVAFDSFLVAMSPQRWGSSQPGVHQALATQLNTSSLTFNYQVAGGYFEDVKLTPQQQMAAACLVEFDYGLPLGKGVGRTMEHAILEGPIRPAELYWFRNFSRIVSGQLETKLRGVRVGGHVAFEPNFDKLMAGSFSILRRLVDYLQPLRSRPAQRLLGELSPLVSGPAESAQKALERTVEFANGVSATLNQTYLKKDEPLLPLPPSQAAASRAFERLFFWADQYLLSDRALPIREVVRQVGASVISMAEVTLFDPDSLDSVNASDILAMSITSDKLFKGGIRRGARKEIAASSGPAVYVHYKRRQIRERAQAVPDRQAAMRELRYRPLDRS